MAVVVWVMGAALEMSAEGALTALDEELVSTGSEVNFDGFEERRNFVFSQEESLEES